MKLGLHFKPEEEPFGRTHTTDDTDDAAAERENKSSWLVRWGEENKKAAKTWKNVLTKGERSGIVSKLSETRRSSQRESKKVFNEVKKVLDKLWRL